MNLRIAVTHRCGSAAFIVTLLSISTMRADEPPYFVTYSHQLEEPGNIEISASQLLGSPKDGNFFVNNLIEFEYGVKAWWTTELYLSAQSTRNEGSLFTGYRIENRFRPLAREHWINPIFYVEYVDVNEADKSMREIVGHDTFHSQTEPVSETRLERKREIEGKLILSSNFKGWNVSTNLIAEKELKNEPWEFGYALGISRPMAMSARPTLCRLCPENFDVGLELYGGLGDRYRFGLQETSHYLAPSLAWRLPGNMTMAFSPGFGLTANSHRVLWRFAVSQEFSPLGRGQRLAKANTPVQGAGDKLYRRHCTACHGPYGEGGRRGPALRTNTVRESSLEGIYETLRNGIVRRGMPSWSHLPPEQLRQIAEWIRSF